MATRDLTYLIDFDVQGAEELTTATTNMEGLAAATNDIDEGTHTVDIEVPETLSTDIGDVETSLGDAGTEADNLTEKGGFLEGSMAKVAAGALIVGEAIDIAGQFIEVGTQLWEAYRAKQELTEQITRGVTEAILAQSGALDIAAGELEDVIANAETADQILSASIWEGIEATQGAEEIAKLRTALLDVGLSFEDIGPTIVAFEDGAGTAIANVFAGNVDNIDLFNQALADAPRVMGQLAPALQDLSFDDFSVAVGDAVQSADSLEGAMLALTNAGFGDLALAFEDQIGALEQLDDAQENVDYGTLIEQTLAAAESSATLRGTLDAVRTDLGPDASEFEVWQEYITRLQEVQTAAEGTDTAIDDAAAPRTGEFDVDLEQARADAEELRGELDGVAEPRTAPITAEAETDDAEDDLDSLPASERVAIIDAQADVITANADLLDAADEPRSALIVAHARTAGAEIDLQAVADAERNAAIDAFLRAYPSSSQILSAVTGGAGRINVPIVGVWSTRTEGNRPR